MFFTQDDYKKIQQWLTKNSVRDTEFNEATIPFKGEEIITVVLDNQNKKVPLRDLVSQIFNLGVSDFINVTDKYDAPNIDLNEAIKLIPSRARKEGQVITFLNKENNWQIYQFRGVLNQWSTLDKWEDLFDWEKLIINSILPDEEDLTKSPADENGNSYLSLKDRVYNPKNFSGLGRVILRKNIVEIEDPTYGKVKKNVLYQDMIDKENTIYIIQYDFILGEDITVPANCVLEFEGGSLSNGTLTGNNTCIEAGLTKIFDANIIFAGTWNISKLFPEWFEFVNGDASVAVNRCISIAKLNNSGTIYFSAKEYIIKDVIVLDNSSNIIVTGNKSVLKKPAENYKLLFRGERCRNITISNLILKGAWIDKTVVIPESGWRDNYCNAIIMASFSENITIENLELYDFWYGVFIGGESGLDKSADTSKCAIRNCYFDGVRAAIDTYSRLQGTIEGNIIKNCTFSAIQLEATYGIDDDDYDYKDMQAAVEGFVVQNNTICDSHNGVHLQFPNDKLGNSNVLIINNKFNNIDNVAIILQSFRGCRVNGNIIENSNRGIAISSKYVDFMVSNNIFINITSGPITIYDNNTYHHFGIICKNIIEECPSVAAITIAASNLIVTENIIRNCINNAEKRGAILITAGNSIIITNNVYFSDYEDGNPTSIVRVNYSVATKNNYIAGNISNISIAPLYWYNESGGVIEEKQLATVQGNNLTILDAWADNATSLFPARYEIFYSKREGRHITVKDDGLGYELVTRRGTFTGKYENKPTNPDKNQLYFASDLEIPIIHRSSGAWFDMNGYTPMKRSGNGLPATNPPGYEYGNFYFNKDNGTPIWWQGNRWNNADGTKATIKRSGTFAEKPSSSEIYVGFKYFCTDKQTIEGGTNGIVVYLKERKNGQDVWVDSLGRLVE